MIAILDYGLGNVRSISNMLRKAGVPCVLAADEADVRACDGAVLPGVGSFDTGMQRLNKSGLRPALEELVDTGRPLLGICLGMQMLGNSSEEGKETGLQFLNAVTVRLEPEDGLSVPHMGWAPVVPSRASVLFPNPADECRFYFLHSYQVRCEDDDDVLARAEYGEDVTSAVGRGHVLGVQFHPEKSHRFGLELFRRWATAS